MEIDDLSDVVELGPSPLTKKPEIDYAYLILQHSLKFKVSLKEWNDKPIINKTLSNFKSHFCDAQRDFCQTGEMIIVDEGMNQIQLFNLVSEGIQQALNIQSNDAE
eukprot:13755516-Ditylum_brightwellii.AAC.1